MVKQWFPDPRRSTQSGETTGADQGQALRRELGPPRKGVAHEQVQVEVLERLVDDVSEAQTTSSESSGRTTSRDCLLADLPSSDSSAFGTKSSTPSGEAARDSGDPHTGSPRHEGRHAMPLPKMSPCGKVAATYSPLLARDPSESAGRQPRNQPFLKIPSRETSPARALRAAAAAGCGMQWQTDADVQAMTDENQRLMTKLLSLRSGSGRSGPRGSAEDEDPSSGESLPCADATESAGLSAASARPVPSLSPRTRQKQEQDYHAFFAELAAAQAEQEQDPVTPRSDHSSQSHGGKGLPSVTTSPEVLRVRSMMGGAPAISCDLVAEHDKRQLRVQVPQNHAKGHWFVEGVSIGGGVYTGEVEGGERHGKGVTKFPDGSEYSGHYMHGVKHGWGDELLANRDQYRGQYEFDEFHGSGTFLWADGRMYQGLWSNGCMDGKGTCTWPNGRKFEGLFDRNEPVKGIMTCPDGQKKKMSFTGPQRDALLQDGKAPESERKGSGASRGIGSWFKHLLPRRSKGPPANAEGPGDAAPAKVESKKQQDKREQKAHEQEKARWQLSLEEKMLN